MFLFSYLGVPINPGNGCKALLNYFNVFAQDLASKGDAVVAVLNLIDHISAVKSATDSIKVASIACTASSEKIYQDWQSKL